MSGAAWGGGAYGERRRNVRSRTLAPAPRLARLHRLAYVAPLLAVIHFMWRVKRDVREPVAYAVVLEALLLVRLGVHLRARRSVQAGAGPR